MADLVCDFVPSECAALAMQACLLAKKCRILDDFKVPALNAQFGGASTLTLELRVTLDAQSQCTIEALQAAFAAAGCPFPALPVLPEVPDLSTCEAALDNIKNDVADPLGFLSSVMTITLDANDKPIRITVP